MLLQAKEITRRFGGIELFSNITFEIKRKSRIGLVGRNGAGKSTLLKILAGIEDPDEGEIIQRKDISIGFLDQHGGLKSNKTIWEEMMTVFEPLIKIEKQLRNLEEKMAAKNKNDDFDKILNEYNQLQEKFERRNGYGYQSEIKTVLHGFKFQEEDFEMNINHLSGGQKTRLALAKLLLEKRDLLVLDEPTNHLDIETLSWLENYLGKYSGAILIVSHDRYFLDKLTEQTLELSYGQLNIFTGNYSKYLEQKASWLKKQQKDFDKQQKKIADMEDFINRNIVNAATSGRAKARRKQLEKIEKIKQPLGDERSVFFNFTPERQSGNIVLQTSNLSIGYEKEQPLSIDITLDIQKGDIIALVGPNGIGKSTLLKTIIGKINQLAGEVHFGTKVDTGYYDQEQENLTFENSILNEMWNEHPMLDEEKIRTFLGSFLFSGDDVEKSITSLSGGERARVSLAKLALNHDNFLILDEPTNHLDIDSKEVLENALIHFNGTILFVSHDRYFINRLASKVVELDSDGSTLFLGDYDYYLHKKEEIFELEKAKNKKENSNHSVTDTSKTSDRDIRRKQKREERRIQRKIDQIEKEIADKESDINHLMQKINNLSQKKATDQEDILLELNDLSIKYDTKEEQLNKLMNEWENLSQQLEEHFD